ncbi:MAG: hypothetical protein VYA97_09055, partial [Pseudomonadota bacterium]|nr:hypothetical protein [Pseudomonadota bacterium]
MFWFSIASLTPPVLIGLASLWGGGWSWAALGSMSALVLVLDRIGRQARNQTGARGAIGAMVSVQETLSRNASANEPKIGLSNGCKNR